MRESNTYQEILDEGRIEGRTEGELQEARRLVLRAGVRRLGAASPSVAARVEAVVSLEVLETLLIRIFDVETWDDLLADVPNPA